MYKYNIKLFHYDNYCRKEKPWINNFMNKLKEFFLKPEIRYTLPENETQIFASKYKLYLPSEEELSQELQREYMALEYDKEKSN